MLLAIEACNCASYVTGSQKEGQILPKVKTLFKRCLKRGSEAVKIMKWSLGAKKTLITVHSSQRLALPLMFC